MLVSDRATDGTLISELSKCSEKRVEADCDGCGRRLTLIWANYRRGQDKRKGDGKTHCRSCQSKRNVRQAHASGPWNKGCRIPVENRRGKSFITSDGYRSVFRFRVHRDEGSQWSNYRKEHLLVMEEKLKRPLDVHEIIHHIDGDKLNNIEENLWLTDAKGHRQAHNSIQKAAYELFRRGLIVFDSSTGQYRVAE